MESLSALIKLAAADVSIHSSWRDCFDSCRMLQLIKHMQQILWKEDITNGVIYASSQLIKNKTNMIGGSVKKSHCLAQSIFSDQINWWNDHGNFSSMYNLTWKCPEHILNMSWAWQIS